MIKKFGRFTLIKFSAVAFFVFNGGTVFGADKVDHSDSSDGPSICAGCNVVFISADSVRADHMSLYGYKRKTTPQIDKWSRQGIVFKNFFATAYLTPISEGSIHTGLYPDRSGLINFQRSLSLKYQTMAEIFKESGYKTAAIGNSPEYAIFESLRQSFSRGFDVYEISPRLPRKAGKRGLDMSVVDKQLVQGKRPFFLWITFGDAHAPFGYMIEQRFKPRKEGIFAKNIVLGNFQNYYNGYFYPFKPATDFTVFTGDKGLKLSSDLLNQDPTNKTKKWPVKVTAEDLSAVQDYYDNGVAFVDAQVGELLKIIEAKGLAKNTVVVFQSEHGETLGEHGYIAHYDIWDHATKVPLIISNPRRPKGEVHKSLSSGVDVLPTLLAMVGIKGKPYFDGADLLNPDTPRRDEVYLIRSPLWESILKIVNKSDSIFDQFREVDSRVGVKDYAIRTERWKLIHRRSRFIEHKYSCWGFISGKDIPIPNEFELYDLKNDPGELRPLLTVEVPIGAELKAKLLAYEDKMKASEEITPTTKQLQDYH